MLACFKHGETFLANQVIARRCKLPRSTVSRLTYTLTRLGYLHYVQEVGKYRRGTRFVAMSAAALGSLDVRRLARPRMRELAEFSGMVVGLAVRDRLSMRYVECTHGKDARSLTIGAGVRMSLVRSSIGRAFVATLSSAERTTLFNELRTRNEATWPRSESILIDAVREHATLGCCCSFGDWNERVSAIAVGFRPGGGLPPMAVNCGASTVTGAPKFLLEQMRPRLIALAHSLNGVAQAPDE